MDGLVWTQFIADIFTVILTYAVYWKLYKESQEKNEGFVTGTPSFFLVSL